MARIRTIKPDFWEDEAIAALSLRARLLFVATWNFADDEGLLRWTPDYITASAFMYDQISTRQVTAVMAELVDAGLVVPYMGGKAQQRLAWIPRFLRHQRINRPQPSKLPPPSLQNCTVRHAYAARAAWACEICGAPIANPSTDDDRFNLSMDHRTPRSRGGSDYPSNIQATHQSCNKSKRDGCTDSVNDTRNGSPLPVVNGSDTSSRPEGKGREVEGSSTDLPPPTDTPSDDRGGKVMQAAARSMALEQAASMGTQVRDHDAFVAAQTAKHLAEHRSAWQTRLAEHPDLSSRQLAEGAGRPPSDTPEAIDARARAELEQTQARIAELHAVPVAAEVPADVREYLARRRSVPDGSDAA